VCCGVTDGLRAGREAVGDDDSAARRRLTPGQLEAVVVGREHVPGGRLRGQRPPSLAVREVRLHATTS